jgi:hypothetical protein
VLRTAQTGGNGRFTLDVSDLLLQLNGSAQATLSDLQSDIVRRYFPIVGLPTFLPVIRR